jgi:hypothetical protein
MNCDAIQIDARARQAQRKVANLNPPANRFLGLFNHRGEKVVVEGAAPHNQDAGNKD